MSSEKETKDTPDYIRQCAQCKEELNTDPGEDPYIYCEDFVLDEDGQILYFCDWKCLTRYAVEVIIDE